MAADLPTINAINQLEETTDSGFEYLGQQIYDGMSDIASELTSINDSISSVVKEMKGVGNVLKDTLKADERARAAAYESQLEAMRKQKQEKQKEKETSKKDGLGLLGWAGILAGIATALTAGLVAAMSGFVTELLSTLSKVFKSKFLGKLTLQTVKLTELFENGFKGFGKSIANFFGKLRKSFFGNRTITSIGTRMSAISKNIAFAVDVVKDLFAVLKAVLKTQFAPFIAIVNTAIVRPIKDAILLSKYLFKQITDIFRPAQQVADAAEDTAKSVQKGASLFSRIGSLFKPLTDIVQPIIKVMGTVGRILGKIFLPFTIAMTVWDTIKGAIQGFEEAGILGGMVGAFGGLLKSIVGIPLDLLKSAVSWLLGFFGFEKAEEALDSFSFEEIIDNTTKAITNFISNLVDGVGKFFDNPGQMISDTFDSIWAKVKSLFDPIINFNWGSIIPDWVMKLGEMFMSDEEKAALEKAKKAEEEYAKTAKLAGEYADKQRSLNQEKIDAARSEYLRLQNDPNAKTGDLMSTKNNYETLLSQRESMRGDAYNLRIQDAIRSGRLNVAPEVDVRSREVASKQTSPVINVTAPQTNMTTDNSVRVQKTTMAAASPRRGASSPQTRDYDPVTIGGA